VNGIFCGRSINEIIKTMLKQIFILFIALQLLSTNSSAQQKENKISVIAYYAGDAKTVDEYPIEKLTHIIFSFCHLKGNKLTVDGEDDAANIKHLVSLKKRNASLKVILSLGGWGGCKTCSAVFSMDEGRKEFAQSVKYLCEEYKTDGIDIDWEYPAIEGYPGHLYTPEDKHNFTLLIQTLRQTLGTNYEISFAAGGFTKYLTESVEWNALMSLVDRVNIMSYDLINGYSLVTGHHTPLYSTPEQIESTDHAVRYLDSVGVPKNKMVIGAAFYARIFDADTNVNNGLYQPGKFYKSVSYKQFDRKSLEDQGYTYYWDDTAKAPYMYNPATKKICTFDDERSVMLKTKYAINQHLNGIMFWELADDNATHDLLNAIDKAVHE
jgi:chitinase